MTLWSKAAVVNIRQTGEPDYALAQNNLDNAQKMLKEPAAP